MLRWTQSKVVMPPLRSPNLQAKVAPAVARGAVMLLKKIQEILEPHRKSGSQSLVDSWRVTSEGMDAIVYSEDPASVYLDQGTKAHVIRPKHSRASEDYKTSVAGLKGKARKFELSRPETFLAAPALKFEVDAEFDPLSGEMFGEVILRPKVNHPGTTGIFYIMRAEEEIMPQIRLMIQQAVVEVMEESLPAIPTIGLFEGAVISPRTGRAYYGRRGAGGRFIARSR